MNANTNIIQRQTLIQIQVEKSKKMREKNIWKLCQNVLTGGR